MKKRIISCIALIALSAAVTACGAQTAAPAPAETTAAQTTTAAPETTAAETTTTKAPETTAAKTEDSASVSDVVGTWFEDALDPRTLTINEDGTFTLEYKGGGARYGTVKIDHDNGRARYGLYQDEDCWLSFSGNEDGSQLLDIWGTPADEPETHFRRDIAIRDDGIDDPEPNGYGYYPVYSAPETGVSIDALEGSWYCTEEDEYIVFHDTSLYTGEFVITYSDTTIDEGYANLEYSLNPDNSREYWYNLYTYDGEFLLGFSTGDTVPVNDLYAGQSGEPHFERESAFDEESRDNYDPFYEYIGEWKSKTQWNDNDLYIKISEDHGSIIAEVTAHSAVADYQWTYICTGSEDGTYIECTGGGTLVRTDYAPNGDIQDPETVYSDGTAKFNIKGGTLFWEDSKEGTARQVGFGKVCLSAEDFLGVWAVGRITATIEEDGGEYLVNIHWSSSAAEGSVWEYRCTFDGGVLRCDGNGTRTDYVYDEDGNNTDTQVYNDGCATFEIKDGTLVWNDEKEDEGAEFLR